jgi:hypothetical protein
MKSIRVGSLVRMNAIGGTDCARKNGSPRPSREKGESEDPFPGSDTPHLGPLPSDNGRGEKAQPATLQRYGSSLAVAIMIAMMAMRSPMRVIPGVSRARVIVRIRLGIRVVRPLVVPVWIIIVARRIGITVPRKSKTESPNPWKSRGDLSVSTLPGNEDQPAYRQSNQEKLLHRFTSSIYFGFCLSFCEGRLRVFLYRGIRMRLASRLPRRIKNGAGSCNLGFQSATGRIRRGEPDGSCRQVS